MNRKLALAVVVLAVLLAGATAWLAATMFTPAPSPAAQAASPNREGDGQGGVTTAAPAPSAAGGDESGGATNSFIVCPGNPRCPKGDNTAAK